MLENFIFAIKNEKTSVRFPYQINIPSIRREKKMDHTNTYNYYLGGPPSIEYPH